MKELYGEGVANHTGSESCGGGRKVTTEALTGVRAGRVLSREMCINRGADIVKRGGRQHWAHRQRKMRSDPARSKTPSTHGSSLHENWEVLCLASKDGSEVRAVNPKGARQR